jgi:hypothetical protein
MSTLFTSGRFRLCSALALAVFLFTLVRAPWEGRVRITNSDVGVGFSHAPLWAPPDFQRGASPRLRLDILGVEWLAISGLAAGILVLAPHRSSALLPGGATPPAKEPSRRTPFWIKFVVLAALIAIYLLLACAFWFA